LTDLSSVQLMQVPIGRVLSSYVGNVLFEEGVVLKAIFYWVNYHSSPRPCQGDRGGFPMTLPSSGYQPPARALIRWTGYSRRPR